MLVSVIIPCYNVADCVQRAVDSAFAQTHADLEVIAVDDGSTDNTLTVLQELQQRYGERLRIIPCANQGACAARNTGLGAGSGSYIEFLDADDALLPEKIAHQLALAHAEGLPDLIVGSAIYRGADGNETRRDVQDGTDRDPWYDLMRHAMGGTPQNLWKRSAVEAVEGWDGNMRSSQEYDLMFRMLRNDATVVYDAALYTEVFERARGSISRTGLDRNWERFVALRVRILEHLSATRPALELAPYHQALFDSIRTLYLHAPKRAVELYHRHLPTGFRPSASAATGKGYLLLHGLFGFRWANRLRGMLR